MKFPTIVKLSELKDSPEIHMDLPGPIAIGTRIHLVFSVQRRNGNRTEVLKASGEFKVDSYSLDGTRSGRQVITVSSLGVAPSWRSVKNPPRKLGSPKLPRTHVA